MRPGPFFQYFGAKWDASGRLPPPRHGLVVEAFAGSACYATRYASADVLLCDLSPQIAGIWRYLIRTTAAEILRIPDLPVGSVDDLPDWVPEEARWLAGFWVQTACGAPRRSVSSRSARWAALYPHRVNWWGPPAKERIAVQVDRIRHWKVVEASYALLPNPEATWIVDPPYQGDAGRTYPFGSDGIDYARLRRWVLKRRGLVIVHEGPDAEWFPEAKEVGASRMTSRTHGSFRGVERLAVWDSATEARR